MSEWRRRWFHRFMYRAPALLDGETVVLECPGMVLGAGGTCVLTNQRLLLVRARQPRPMYAVPAGTSAWKPWRAVKQPAQTAIQLWNIAEVGELEPKRWYTWRRPFTIMLRSGRTLTITAQSSVRLRELLVEAGDYWTQQRLEWETSQAGERRAGDETPGGS